MQPVPFQKYSVKQLYSYHVAWQSEYQPHYCSPAAKQWGLTLWWDKKWGLCMRPKCSTFLTYLANVGHLMGAYTVIIMHTYIQGVHFHQKTTSFIKEDIFHLLRVKSDLINIISCFCLRCYCFQIVLLPNKEMND